MRRFLVPGKVYRLYGIRYWVLRFVSRTTNSPFFVNFFGDSSYIVGYLRWVGYRVPRTGQTGSNFGASLTHVTPYLCVIGEDTMVSDGGRADHRLVLQHLVQDRRDLDRGAQLPGQRDHLPGWVARSGRTSWSAPRP